MQRRFNVCTDMRPQINRTQNVPFGTLPLITALFGEYTFGCEDDFDDSCDRAAAYGMGVGALLATALDAYFLARRWRPVEVERASGLRIVPIAVVGPERNLLGLGLSF